MFHMYNGSHHTISQYNLLAHYTDTVTGTAAAVVAVNNSVFSFLENIRLFNDSRIAGGSVYILAHFPGELTAFS